MGPSALAFRLGLPIAVFASVILAPNPEELTDQGQSALAVMGVAVVLWATETLHIAVTGMVGAFGTIATAKGGVEPSEFAGDISMALMTTVLGLTVAIPTSAFYVFFRNRVTMVGLEVGGIVEDMFERFRTT